MVRRTPPSRSDDAPTAPVTLRCPRCGYDVSGPVETWRESCPVEGTCTECGFKYWWGDVVNPLRVVPRWFFELAPLRRVWALPATCLRTLTPGRFWSRVTLSHPVRARRLVILIAGVFIAVWLLLSGVMLLAHWRFGAFGTVVYTSTGGTPLRFAWSKFFKVLRIDLGWPSELSDWYWLYGVPKAGWLVFVFLCLAPVGFACLGRTLGRAKVRRAHVMRAAVYTGASGLLFFCAVEALRWGGMLCPTMNPWGRRERLATLLEGAAEWLMMNHWAVVGLQIPWAVFAWWCVCRHYFRIEHPLWVAVAMTIIGGLLVLLLTVTFTHALAAFLMDFV